mmetsp:Transcript_881/g.3061  ORF Transcript_881/g.3061 Transcript_881/m.3061 type:complete len:216 (-) Transcript_881:711-1358(-)
MFHNHILISSFWDKSVESSQVDSCVVFVDCLSENSDTIIVIRGFCSHQQVGSFLNFEISINVGMSDFIVSLSGRSSCDSSTEESFHRNSSSCVNASTHGHVSRSECECSGLVVENLCSTNDGVSCCSSLRVGLIDQDSAVPENDLSLVGDGGLSRSCSRNIEASSHLNKESTTSVDHCRSSPVHSSHALHIDLRVGSHRLSGSSEFERTTQSDWL